MKVPVRWLQSLVEVDADLEALSDRLTFAGLEVEAIETIGDTFDGVVAGKVTEILPHPNAEKLQLCTVDYGTPSPCGWSGSSECRGGWCTPLRLSAPCRVVLP